MPEKPTYEELEQILRKLEQSKGETRSADGEFTLKAQEWETIFDMVNDAIWVLSNDQRVQYANKTAEEFFRVPIAEMIGKHCWEIVHATEGPVHECPFLQAMKSHTREMMELQIGEGWFLVTADPILGSNGNYNGAIHIVRDITEHKRTLEALRNSEEKYRSLFENTGTATFVSEEDMTISQVNTKCEELSGYSKKEIVGKMKTTDFVTPEDLERIMKYHIKRRKEIDQPPPEYELNIVNRQGNEKTALIQVGMIPETKQSIASIIDITPLKQVEEALRKSEEQFRNVYNTAPLAFVIWDRNTRVIDWNNKAEEVFGWSKEDVVGCSFFDFIIPEKDRPHVEDVVEDLIKGELLSHSINDNLTREGKIITCEWNNSLLHDTNGNVIGAISLGLDITVRKQVEKEKMKLQNNLLQAQKMEAIASLAGGIAHQFNNALSPVSINLDMIEMDYPGDEKIAGYTKQMKDSTLHMVELTNQLLAYARGGKYQAKTVTINDFIYQTLPIIKASINPDIKFEMDLASGELNVQMDQTQMQMVLSAVLINASEAMEDNGLIRIATKEEDVDEIFLGYHSNLKPGRYVRLTVEDNGKGMDRDTRERIFEPFFTTKFEGRGLGMASAYGIIKNHKGWISIYSEEGRGTVVRIYLPVTEKGLEKPAKLIKSALEPFKGTGTILIIEDEVTVMDVNRALLERLGFNVLTAMTGKEAISIAKTFDGKIDLALLDIILPDIQGGKVYPLIMKARPDLKVIICSGYSIDGPAQKILDAGAQAFIQKPFTVATISEKLKEVFEGQ